jgi:hypothetical protein
MKYKIEGNIDFFSELYKSLDVEETHHKNESDNNLCLITNQPLTDKFVELNCSHKFNYLPLYNDIYNHKKKFNNMEGTSSSLKVNEIRCPYCRKKQQGVLPYYSELISEKINGVNFYDTTTVTTVTSQGNNYSFGKCEFIMDPIIINSHTTNDFCTITYVTKSECNNKTYCWRHNRIMNKKFEKEKKDKEKEAQKKLKEEAKQKVKDEKNKIKEEENLKKASEKLLKKTKSKSKIYLSITDGEDENVVISSSTQLQKQNNNEGCSQIIKTGINKGNPCGLAILNDCLCKRHYNLKNKNYIIKYK